MYLYHAGQGGTYGTDIVWLDSTGNPLSVATGKWHELTTRVMLNTPGTGGSQGLADGRVQAWFDGRLAADASGFRFRDRDTMHVDRFYFSTFFGGSTADFEPPDDNRIFFDDFLVADSISPALPSGVRRPFRTPPIPPRPRIRGRKLSWEGGGGPSTAVLADLSGRVLSTAVSPTGSVDIMAPPSADGVLVWKLSRSGADSFGKTLMP